MSRVLVHKNQYIAVLLLRADGIERTVCRPLCVTRPVHSRHRYRQGDCCDNQR